MYLAATCWIVCQRPNQQQFGKDAMNKKMRQAIALGEKIVDEKQDEPCVACYGSGRYDAAGSPKCSACNGTGRQPKRLK